MDMQRFSEENRRRCEHPKGFNHKLDSWSLSDWFAAVMGELGEAANVAKKLNRVRDGIPGNKETEEELRVKLGRELADTYIYLDLLCQRVGVDLSACVRQAFFEKSIQIGYERWDITNPHTRRWLQENLPNELASQLARETTLPAEPEPVFKCPRCHAVRPRSEWGSRYGIATCQGCLSKGYVILPETLHGEQGSGEVPK